MFLDTISFDKYIYHAFSSRNLYCNTVLCLFYLRIAEQMSVSLERSQDSLPLRTNEILSPGNPVQPMKLCPLEKWDTMIGLHPTSFHF